MKKRLISIVFALLMLCQLLSFSILAEPAYDDPNEVPGQNWENPVYYTVTLPTDPVGYTITAGDTEVMAGESFSFTVEVLDGYNGDAMVVKANGETLTATDDVYTITVNEAVEITVTGVVEEADEPEGLAGDIDGNGEITVKDITILRQYNNGYEGLEYDEKALDIDGNGEITVKDITILRQYNNGYEGLTIYYNGKVAATT